MTIIPVAHPERNLLRIGAISSVVGLVLGGITIAFHGGMHPENLQTVLPEYAANRHWELVHLVQFVSDVLMLIGFLALYRSIMEGISSTRAGIGMVIAVVAEAIYGVNQAVDGIAIKFVAQQWVRASVMEKPDALRIAEAVRHIEIGLSSVWTLTGGISLLFFGLAMASLLVAPWTLWLAFSLWRKAGTSPASQ